ncbi:hypothetical protein ACYSNM_10950 [Myroides sp. LJL116]
MTYNIKFSILGVVLLFFIGAPSILAQSSIGKFTNENASVLLDFNPDETRGIILPWVTALPQGNNLVGGTLLFDAQEKKVKYFKAGSESQWVDLSVKTGEVPTQAGLQENTSFQNVIIGNTQSDADGVLVLESTQRAMVLPKVKSPHLNMLSPSPGTIAYDTDSKMLCIFDGKQWSFWKAN